MVSQRAYRGEKRAKVWTSFSSLFFMTFFTTISAKWTTMNFPGKWCLNLCAVIRYLNSTHAPHTHPLYDSWFFIMPSKCSCWSNYSIYTLISNVVKQLNRGETNLLVKYVILKKPCKYIWKWRSCGFMKKTKTLTMTSSLSQSMLSSYVI